MPDEVIKLAARICDKEVSETQINYLIGSKGLDGDQVTAAVDFIERTKTKAYGLAMLFVVLVVYLICNLLLSLVGV